MGTLHLSEVITAADLMSIENNKICIVSGVGSGKNWFVEHELSQNGNILYITSRRAKVNEILEEKIAQEAIIWNNDKNDIVTTTNYGIQKLVMNEKFNGRLSEIIKHFSFIVVDEAHSIVTDASYAESAFHVSAFLEYVAQNYPAIKIILMTGTPEPIKSLLKNYHIIDKREECINIVPKSIKFITKKQALDILLTLPNNEKTIYYSNSARKIVSSSQSWYNALIEAGCDNNQIAICMSENSISKNKKFLPCLDDICTQTKEALTQKRTLPANAKFLFTTSTLKEGVNIEDTSIRIAFCESHLLSDIQQFAGRVRTTLDILYIIEDAEQHNIDEKTLQSYVLEALFSYLKVCASANEYFEEKIKDPKSNLYIATGYDPGLIDLEFLMIDEYSLYNYGGEAAKAFIKLIESKHQYVKFNHLTGQFNYFKNRMVEQQRVRRSIYKKEWAIDLANFCQKYGISYTPPVTETALDKEAISQYLSSKLGKTLITTDRENLRQYLANTLGTATKQPQWKTLNKLLQDNNLPFVLMDGITSKGTSSTRYIRVDSI